MTINNKVILGLSLMNPTIFPGTSVCPGPALGPAVGTSVPSAIFFLHPFNEFLLTLPRILGYPGYPAFYFIDDPFFNGFTEYQP
jgi:hypothetical protein